MLARPETQTPREIAAAVKKTTAHISLEAQSHEAAARHDALRADLREVIGRNRNGARLDGEIARLSQAIEAAGGERREVAARLRPLREEYASRLARVLKPLQAEAAGEALSALSELRSAWDILATCAALVEGAGGEVRRVPPSDFWQIELVLRQAAGLPRLG